MQHYHPIVSLITIFFTISLSGKAENNLTPLQEAINHQHKFTFVEIDITQTKEIPALKKPTTTKGKLWLAPQKMFRWDNGTPAKSTAVYNGNNVIFLNHQNMTAEKVSPSSRKAKALMGSLGIGQEFASLDALLENFTLVETESANGRFISSFSPKNARLRRVLEYLTLQVRLDKSHLERMQWKQKDGTVITTVFHLPKTSKTIPPDIFKFDEKPYKWD